MAEPACLEWRPFRKCAGIAPPDANHISLRGIHRNHGTAKRTHDGNPHQACIGRSRCAQTHTRDRDARDTDINKNARSAHHGETGGSTCDNLDYSAQAYDGPLGPDAHTRPTAPEPRFTPPPASCSRGLRNKSCDKSGCGHGGRRKEPEKAPKPPTWLEGPTGANSWSPDWVVDSMEVVSSVGEVGRTSVELVSTLVERHDVVQ